MGHNCGKEVTSTTDEATPLNEDLIVRSAGYLKFPKRFKLKYPNCENSETPTASIKESGDNISLIFTWKREDLQIVEGE